MKFDPMIEDIEGEIHMPTEDNKMPTLAPNPWALCAALNTWSRVNGIMPRVILLDKAEEPGHE